MALAIGALAGLAGLAVWGIRKATGGPRTPHDYNATIAQAETEASTQRAAYERLRGDGDAALAALRREPPLEGEARRGPTEAYQRALVQGLAARNAMEEFEVVKRAYRVRTPGDNMRPAEEFTSFLIDASPQSLRDREDQNRPDPDALTYADYAHRVLSEGTGVPAPRPAWPAADDNALPAHMNDLGNPFGDEAWRARVAVRFRNLQRDAVRDVVEFRKIDPDRVRTMTLQQLAYLLAGLKPPRRGVHAAAEQVGPAVARP